MQREFFTEPELGGYIRTPPETLRYWRSCGRGPRYFKVGRRVLYDRADVDKWIAEQQVSPEGMA